MMREINRYWSLLIFLCFVILFSCLQSKEKQNISSEEPETDYSEKVFNKERPSNRTVVAFGSCSKQYIPNQRWLDILKNDPDIWIWLGDNIYADTHDMDIMADKYALQKADSGYQLLLQTETKIIGTWDDHDYVNLLNRTNTESVILLLHWISA